MKAKARDAMWGVAARVVANTESGLTKNATTQANGNYVLVGVPPGTYQVKVTGPGFEQTQRVVRVQIGQTLDLDLMVAKEAPVTLERPDTQASRWGMTFAYTYSEAEETGGDLFSLVYPLISDYPRHPTSADERHRVVMSGIVGLPWDVKLSTLITLGSGTGYTIIDQSAGTGPGEIQHRYSQKLSLVAEAFNVFDFENYDPASYNGNIPGPGQPANDAFGQPTQLIEPGRRLQFGATYSS